MSIRGLNGFKTGQIAQESVQYLQCFILTMLNFLVGWVELAKSQLLHTSLVSLPDCIRIAESLNPTPNLTLSSYNIMKIQPMEAFFCQPSFCL